MNEFRRLAYLDALGVDSYVSRRQLPGAAPSPRVGLRRRQPAVAPAQARPDSAALSRIPVMPQRSAVPAAPPVSAVPTAHPAETGLGPVFSVLAGRLGGWYWLDEIPWGRQQGPEYLLLLQSICAALGLPYADPQLERFDWPIAGARQPDNTEHAARDGFSGFLCGRLERNPVHGLVLLGVGNEPWLDRAGLDSLPVVKKIVETASAWRMLRQAKLKKQAWKELQDLRQPG